MTLINLRGLIDALPAPAPIDAATVRIQRWSGHAPAVIIDGPGVTFPANVAVTIASGLPDETIDVPPTDGRYCIRWTITAPLRGLAPVYRYTSIPPAGPVDFADLIDVDPTTFAPSGTATAAWLATLREVAQLADEVATDAAAAGTSAFNAGASAAAALGHANAADAARDAAVTARTAAQTARTGAEGARDESVTARTAAQTAKTGAEGARDESVTARTAAQTAKTGAEGARDESVTARTAAQTAKTGADAARAAAEAARDLALAGQFLGANVAAAVDANTLTTPGVFRFGSAVAAASTNLPVPRAGLLEVHNINGGGTPLQRFTEYGATQRGIYIRWASAGGWGAWRFIASQRVDQTAGRAIYTWDDLNNREQLIYGDTGWRDISADLINGWSGTAQLRRVGALVELKFNGLDPSAQTSATALQLAAGFRPGGTNERPLLHTATTPATVYRMSITGGSSASSINAAANAGLLYGSGTFMTSDTWPTVLPGTAVGSIPA
ncbi:pyocin knob domain-containing protein [Microbacterium sp. cx-55]|uniref:pyocin knob domain-containing protein n=1 Tax=Microbacterium sp. cx-55 TaxID=2875948 RepID=UPI001CC036A0|nr:pyocin knob domain-containing protein [Microbacterium sp. cx-55]MBZ4486279.1 hypothetical protein [Microbacterium sp. cx-55]